jgi:ribosome-associated protein
MGERLIINDRISIDTDELDWSAMRAQGAGGQNVNKVSSALHLRFDIHASSLPEVIKQRLLDSSDSRLTRDGVLVIKAQQFRTQEANRRDALERLTEIILKATYVAPTRRPTKPTRASQKRRVDAKKRTGYNKSLRGKVKFD